MQWAYQHPESFELLIDLLVEAVVDHLPYQVGAGAYGVQLFDSWAGLLPEEQLFHWSLDHMMRVAKSLREHHPKVPIVAFHALSSAAHHAGPASCTWPYRTTGDGPGRSLAAPRSARRDRRTRATARRGDDSQLTNSSTPP